MCGGSAGGGRIWGARLELERDERQRKLINGVSRCFSKENVILLFFNILLRKIDLLQTTFWTLRFEAECMYWFESNNLQKSKLQTSHHLYEICSNNVSPYHIYRLFVQTHCGLRENELNLIQLLPRVTFP